jgi:ribosomal-protein-alanine N-acetyltransferase
MPFPNEIQTERLVLRWPVETDAEEIFARYASDPEVTRYLCWTPHRSVDDTLAFHREKIQQREQHGSPFNWLVFLRGGGPLLGSIGCRVDKHRVHFGYCYARQAWGRGYATEAAKALVSVWLAEPSVWRVESMCDVEHWASARVLEKAGLVLEGTLRRYAVLPNLGDQPRDMLCYAKVRQ